VALTERFVRHSGRAWHGTLIFRPRSRTRRARKCWSAPDPDWESLTEVEVRFGAEGNATRVEVEHRGWEVGPKATAPGKSYDGGWDFVLSKYTAAPGA
jgi:hypothetical protein